MKPKDRDFIETVEGFLFCVVGYLHPPDKITAYLKYIPSKNGKWKRGETHYTRTLPFYKVTEVEKSYSFLKDKYPIYLFDCNIRNITISSIPTNRIKTYYKPLERVEKLLREGAKDILEQKLISLITQLKDTAGIQIPIGVTGSILTESHNPTFSDIDITIYGYEESMKLKTALENLMENKNTVNPLSEEKQLHWLKNRTKRFPLTYKELKKIYSKRWNYGLIDGTYFSIHPIRKDTEITENYGDYYYSQKGEIKGTATITDISESHFLPAIYKINESELDTNISEISRIVSYEGLYGGLFNEGEKVEFIGNLEHVTGKKEYYQVVIGGAGSKKGYIKWT